MTWEYTPRTKSGYARRLYTTALSAGAAVHYIELYQRYAVDERALEGRGPSASSPTVESEDRPTTVPTTSPSSPYRERKRTCPGGQCVCHAWDE